METIAEKRTYNDNGDPLTALWETANIIARGKILIVDKEGHHEVEISYVLNETSKR